MPILREGASIRNDLMTLPTLTIRRSLTCTLRGKIVSQIDGTYDVTTKTPMGDQNGQLTLQADGNSLSGTLSGDQGSLQIENGAIDGEDLSWTANLTSPMPMKLEFSAKVDGDEISGSVKLGAFGNASFSGTRVS